jgi:hypothetical protein
VSEPGLQAPIECGPPPQARRDGEKRPFAHLNKLLGSFYIEYITADRIQ